MGRHDSFNNDNHITVCRNDENEEKAKEILIFNAFIDITMTYMMFSNGDIALNQAAIGF